MVGTVGESSGKVKDIEDEKVQNWETEQYVLYRVYGKA